MQCGARLRFWCVSGPRGALVYFLVMNNVNAALHKATDESLTAVSEHTGLVATSYDIKGSWVDRVAKPGAATLKDQDLTQQVVLSAAHRDSLIAKLEQDTAWLEEWEIMDYSLLLTIVQPDAHRSSDENVWRVAHSCCDEEFETSHLETTETGNPETTIISLIRTNSAMQRTCLAKREPMVCVGLIDVLQRFDCSKRCELAVKSLINARNKEGLSCIQAAPYRERFMSKMRGVFVALAGTYVKDQLV